jgi:hypothetical protein
MSLTLPYSFTATLLHSCQTLGSSTLICHTLGLLLLFIMLFAYSCTTNVRVILILYKPRGEDDDSSLCVCTPNSRVT